MSYMMNWIHLFVMSCLLAGSQAFPSKELQVSPTDHTHLFCPDIEPLITSNMEVKYFRNSYGFIPGDEVWISCHPGHVIRGGSDLLYCQEDGSWDEEIGRCEAVTCKTPEVLKNGDIPQMLAINNITIPEGFEITYTCNSGFRLTGSSWNRCVNGRWKFDSPVCVGIKCYDPGTPENGMRKGNNFEIGSKVSYSCFSGYILLGSLERYCLPNGQWSGELTRCNSESNYCPDPGVPINGIKIGNIYDESSSVKYRCYPGFALFGSETRECQRDRSWTGVEPKCQSPYDFDNNAEVVQRLKAAMKGISEYPQSRSEPENHPTIPIEETMIGPLLGRKKPLAFNPTETMIVPLSGMTEGLAFRPIYKRDSVGHWISSYAFTRVITYFIFDSSGSIGNGNFRMCIEFAKTLVKKMKISSGGNRVGALSFSSEAIIHFFPEHFESTDEVLKALDEITYLDGGTAMNKVFERLLNDLIPLSRKVLGANTKSVVYVFTDGKANMGGDPKLWADKLKETGMEINCIGIAGAEKEDLYKIASEPLKEHVFMLSSYSQMQQLNEMITSDAVDYSRCGFGLEDVVIHYEQNGGSESMRNASQPWPWMAALYMSDSIYEVPSEVKCGGSVVGNRWILTAAHCLKEKNNKNKVRDRRTVIIKLGITKLSDESTVAEYSADMFFIHPSHDPLTLDYDIALIKLDELIEFNSYVRPVCLPPEGLPENTTLYKYMEHAFVTGWGSTQKQIPTPRSMSRMRNVENLKEIILQIQTGDRCQQSLRNTNFSFTETMFCAGSESSNIDTCKGDSGSPMVQHQLDDEGTIYWVQVGIVSWGLGCRLPGTYGFYSHVHRVRQWITDTMNSN